MTLCGAGGGGDEGERMWEVQKTTEMIKCMLKFSSERLYSLKSPMKISLKHDWIRVKVDETPR